MALIRIRVVLAIAAAIGLALCLARPPFWLVRVIAARRRDLVFYGDTRERLVALTLDDGPHPDVTPRVLEVLRRHGAHATFFVIGARAIEARELLARIVAEDHELGNHTWDDVPSAALSDQVFENAVRRTHEVLAKAGSVQVWRPGSGLIERRKTHLAERLGYHCVLGSVYPQDAHVAWRRYIVRDVLVRVRPGAIVILHEVGALGMGIVDVLDEVLSDLNRRHYEIVTVSELLERSAKQEWTTHR